MRAMSAEFGISYWQVQQTLTVYLVPYACMSLVHGSLSDAVGRRRVVLVGLVLYAFASMGCALAPGFGALLFCRALQGMVGGVGMIIGRAVVRDCFSGAQAQRVMSAITIMFSLGPALAPVIGGWIHVWLGWRAVFGSMALYALVLAWMVYRKLPETLGLAHRTPLEFGALAGNLYRVARHPEFLLLTTASGLCFVVLQIYVGSAPAIILDHWGGSEVGFAMLTVPIISGYAIGAVASGRMAGRLPPARQANYGYTLLLAATGAMLVLQRFVDHPPVFAQQLLLTSMAFGLQLLFPDHYAAHPGPVWSFARRRHLSAHLLSAGARCADDGRAGPVAVAVDATSRAHRIHFQFRRLVRMAACALVPTALPGGTFLRASDPVAGRSSPSDQPPAAGATGVPWLAPIPIVRSMARKRGSCCRKANSSSRAIKGRKPSRASTARSR